MEQSPSPAAISLDTRLEFWRTTLLRLGRVSPSGVGREIEPLLAMIDSGALGDDLIREHGAALITHALAHWPTGDHSHWEYGYGEGKKPARLMDYQPGQDWTTMGAHAPLERIVAALLRAGADPWRVPFEEQDGVVMIRNGKTFPPAWFALQDDELPRASFQAFMEHPSRPSIPELMRHRDHKDRSLAELAAANHPEALALFLAGGADPNMLDHKGLPLLFHAGRRESVKLLVGHGANPDIVDQKGNSLEVAWGLKHPVMASTLISELPKRAKNAAPPKASLATIVAALDDPRRGDVRSILGAMKDPAAHRWEINGVEVDLLEVVVAISAFSPLRPKAVSLEELSNKKHNWAPSSRRQLHLIRALCQNPNSDDEVRDLGKTLKKKIGDDLPDEEMAEIINRVLQVHRAVMPGASNHMMEDKQQSAILYAWDFLLRKATEEGKKDSPVALPLFQGMRHASEMARRIGVYFSDMMFRCMLTHEKEHPMPDADWKFWTSMGIAGGTIEKNEDTFAQWKQTVAVHDPDWFQDPNIKQQLQRPSRSIVRAEIDQMILDRSAASAPAQRPSPRL